MPLVKKGALTFMISFDALIIVLLTLVVSIVVAVNSNTKK
ncbi:putative holin-like toxin [Paenibacillus sp. 23TSA30-6]|nr:putative holin-like toxin [Paenibacillus sp. 23TSA30-6]